jgi:N-acetylglucosamine-6-phosphate deacetylase
VTTVATLKRIRGGTVVTPQGTRDADVVVEDGRIASLVAPGDGNPDGPVLDATGCLVLPGLVDIHLHGAGGTTFNDADPNAWRAVLDHHLAHGTTTAVATIMTDETAQLLALLDTARALLAPPDCPPSLAGVHLEGPYLAAEQRGAHPMELLRTPDDGWWRELDLDAIRIVTLAPELPGASTFIRACAARDVVVAAGHSSAGEEALAAAVADGLSHITHLWSGQSMLRKDGPWRVPGLCEAALSSDGLTGELIADGRHLPASLVRIGHRCLGPDRACLVSDASAGTGLTVGSRFRMGATDGVVADGVAVTADGASFCGSTSTLLDTLRYAVTHAGVPLEHAARMAATTSARVARLHQEVGALSPGLRADATILEPRTLALVAVVQQGRLVSARTEAARA